jgi:hypothetical protein
MHIRVTDLGCVYPYSADHLRADHPGTSFPVEMPDDSLAEWGVFRVQPTEPPAAAGMVAVECEPQERAGAWWQAWRLEPAPPALPPPVPAEVALWRLRAAVTLAGLLPQVEATIDALAEPPRTVARVAWEFGNTVDRAHPLVALIGQACGMDDAGLDNLFRDAAALGA